MVQSTMPLGDLWLVFSLSLLMSLSGAVMPGPMLTYVIARTLRSGRGAWPTGPRVVAGHAVIEAPLVLALVLGLGSLLGRPVAIKAIAATGAVLLVAMGVGLLVEAVRGKNAVADPDGERPARQGLTGRLPPMAAGVVVSMSNPYWWVWWITIGAAFLVRYDLTLARWPLLLAFFIGHELGDLGWFLAVSLTMGLGGARMPRGLVTGIQALCAVAMAGFGLYLGISSFLPR